MNPLLIAQLVFGILDSTGVIKNDMLRQVLGEIIADGPEIFAQIKAELANVAEPSLEDLIAAKAKIRAPYQFTEDSDS